MKHALCAVAACAVSAVSLFAAQPSVVSVTPSSQMTDGSDVITYTFIASDPIANDLKGIDVLFGDQYECWFWFEVISNQISVWKAGVWTTEKASQPGAILHGNDCDIDPFRVTYSDTSQGLNVKVRVRIGGAPAAHNIYMSATSLTGEYTAYRQLGTWTVAATPAPFMMTVKPPDGFTRPGDSATATVTITDSPGFNGAVNLSLGAFPNDSNLTGSFSPASITGNGSSTLTIHSTSQTPVGYDPVDILATASDSSAQRKVQFETFIDNAPPALGIAALSPAAGPGQTFFFWATDNASAYEITGLNILFNSSLDGRNACWLWYDSRSNYLWLANDDGISWQGEPFTASTPLSNSQCRVGGAGSFLQNQGSDGNELAR